MARGGPVGRVAAMLVGAMATLVLVAGVAGRAQAHDGLTGSEPSDGATVDLVPADVVLTFTAPAIELGTQVLVTGPDGSTVSDGPAAVNGATVTQPLVAARPAGAYRVDWRVTSQDGHPVSGSFTFTASNGTEPPPTTTPPTPVADEPTTTAGSSSPGEPSSEAPQTSSEPSPDATAVIAPPVTDSSANADDGLGRGGLIAGLVAVLVVAGLAAAMLGRRARHRRAHSDPPPDTPVQAGR